MKTIDEYMKIPYKLEIIPDSEESGFVASYPDLPGCITCGSTISGAVNNAEDAKKSGSWLPLKKILKLQNQKVPIIIPVNSSYVFQNLCTRLLPKILKRKA